MGTIAERDKIPAPTFVELALKPAPIYFESEDNSHGVCCVCNKKGVLGRCPNPKCGLLMHFTCSPSREKGARQPCPVCRDDLLLKEDGEDLPYWHEAEVGATIKKKHRPSADIVKPPLPHDSMADSGRSRVLRLCDPEGVVR